MADDMATPVHCALSYVLYGLTGTGLRCGQTVVIQGAGGVRISPPLPLEQITDAFPQAAWLRRAGDPRLVGPPVGRATAPSGSSRIDH